MDYYDLLEELKKIILPVLEEEDTELIELDLIRPCGSMILKLLVDRKEGGINLQDCANLNKKLGDILESRGVIKNRYILEVSSPGLDRPLKTKADFSRCINRKIRVFLKEQINGKFEIEGSINKVGDDSVYIDVQGQTIEIPLAKVTKAKQIVSNI